jgi:hypothetical protein
MTAFNAAAALAGSTDAMNAASFNTTAAIGARWHWKRFLE